MPRATVQAITIVLLFVFLVGGSYAQYADESLVSPKNPPDPTSTIQIEEPRITAGPVAPGESRQGMNEYGEGGSNRVLGNLSAGGRYMTVADNGLFEQSADGSLEAWIYQTAQTTTHMIVSKGAFDLFWGIRQLIGQRQVLTIGNTQLQNSDGVVIALNTWTHVAVSWNISAGNITATFYVNGAASGTPVVATGAWVNNTTDFRIGDWHGGANNFFAGQIDEVRLWGDVRTQVEFRDNRFVGIGDGANANASGALTSSSAYQGCVASWTFNLTGSTVFEDISLLNGTLTGGAATEAASLPGNPIPYNFALRLFGGANDFVTVPTNTAFNQTGAGSIDAWVSLTTASVLNAIVVKGTSFANHSFALGITAGNKLFLNIGPQNYISTGPTTFAINKWYHVAATWSGGPNFTVRLYVNGQLDHVQSSSTPMPTNTDPVTIGKYYSASGYFQGYIDEVRVWNVEMTQEDVKSRMSSSVRSGVFGSECVAAWNFDGNLLNFGTTAGINGSFSTGGTNNGRLSGFLNETSTGTPSTSFNAHATTVNRGIVPNPFPAGFAKRVPNKPLPDVATTRDTITISSSATLTAIEVFLHAQHTYASDLDILLRAPNGQTRDLSSNNGGGADGGYLTFFVDGQSPVNTAGRFSPFSPVCGPEVPMGNFGGANTQGNWILEITDDFAADIGTLIAWGIRLNNSLTGIQPITDNIPEKIHLYQNYPNPFNPATTIKFDLPRDGNVKIVVYDILGREAHVLVNQYTRAGEYEIPFDGKFLSSGTYFYRIEANGFTDIKKMILLK